MKIPNKRELQQIAIDHSPDIDFRDFMNIYKKIITKPYWFLVIDTTLASDNLLCFRNDLLERIYKLIMTNDDKIRDKKLQYYTVELILFKSSRGFKICTNYMSFRIIGVLIISASS